MKIYIYQIWFPTSEKSYIGETINLKGRMFVHLCSKFLVGNALRKYDDWQITILHIVKNRDLANLIEIEEIRNFNSVAPNGYNLTHGGEGGDYNLGKSTSEETKVKLRQAGLGNQNAKGYYHTEEAKLKMKKSAKSRPSISEETREKLRQSKLGNHVNLGRKHSKESKLNMRISQLKRRLREADNAR